MAADFSHSNDSSVADFYNSPETTNFENNNDSSVITDFNDSNDSSVAAGFKNHNDVGTNTSYANNNTIWHSSITIGDPCSEDIQCYTELEFSVCVNNTCVCGEGYISNELTECIPNPVITVHSNITIGDTCFEDSECYSAIEYTVCFNSTCTCENGYIFDGYETCIPRNLSDLCLTNEDCLVIENSICSNYSCQCLSYFKAASNNMCEKRLIGDSCRNHSNCASVLHAICDNETCVCQFGFLEENNLCRQRMIGDSCSSNEDCVAIDFSICNGTCSCMFPYIETDSYSCSLRKLGDACENTQECDVSIDNSVCTNNTCICGVGYKPSTSDSPLCVLRQLFDPCETDVDCIQAINNSFCTNRTCDCVSGFVENENGSCSKRRLGFDSCSVDSDCFDSINMSFCDINQTCSCNSGYISSENGKVCRRKKIYDPCSSDEDCRIAVTSSSCFKNQCLCIAGFHAQNENKTCFLRRIGDQCKSDDDCYSAVEESKCKNRTCTCQDGYLTSLKKDVCTKRNLNDNCQTTVDCSAAVTNSWCANWRCSCKNEYDETDNGTACVKRPVFIEDACYFPSQCKHIDIKSTCLERCTCPSEHFVSVDKRACIAYPKIIGNKCSKHLQCMSAVKNSFCGKNKTCVCRTGYFSDQDGAICRRYPSQIRDRCLTDIHCRFIPETSCVNYTCLCNYKFMSSADRWTCLPRKRVGFPKPQNIWLGGLCNLNDENPCPNWNITNQWCSSEDGRVNYRCRCLPGFANVYNAGDCIEIQTYYIRVNITKELGCYKIEDDQPRCYIFTKSQYLKQYSNNNTRKYRDMKLRIQILGLDNAFNRSRLRSRFIASDLINMTEIPEGIQVSALIHITEDYYSVLNASVLADALKDYLEMTQGSLGVSNLKVNQPYKKNIFADDFDECTDWHGKANDCANFSWCINTYGSFMCSCRYEYEDLSFDTSRRPGRVCEPEAEKITHNDARCSDGKCETNWTWMGLTLSLLLIMLIIFLGHEVYAKRKALIQSDPTYVPVKRRSVRKSRKAKGVPSTVTERENLIDKDRENYEEGGLEDPPLYTEEP